MADNIVLNPGSGGSTLASDDVGGVQYQRVKPAYGADGSATDVTSTTPLPVQPAKSASSTNTQVSLTASTDTTLIASNANRILATVYNPLAVDLYVLFGSGASATVYTLRVPPNGFYEVPGAYTGQINGFATAAGTIPTTQVVNP